MFGRFHRALIERLGTYNLSVPPFFIHNSTHSSIHSTECLSVGLLVFLSLHPPNFILFTVETQPSSSFPSLAPLVCMQAIILYKRKGDTETRKILYNNTLNCFHFHLTLMQTAPKEWIFLLPMQIYFFTPPCIVVSNGQGIAVVQINDAIHATSCVLNSELRCCY